jgi:hypothetical protein
MFKIRKPNIAAIDCLHFLFCLNGVSTSLRGVIIYDFFMFVPFL